MGKKVPSGYKPKFVKLDRELIRSRQYRLMGSSARDLYTWMMDTLYDDSDGYANTNAMRIRYGPRNAVKMGMSKTTYYRALERMLHYGVATEVETCGHGKGSVYDLTAWEWKNGS